MQREEKPKPRKREEKTVEIDDRMKNLKVFGNIDLNGKVVTNSDGARKKSYRTKNINWEPRIQVSSR